MRSEHDERVARERAFHDERFAGDQRTVTTKYYDVEAGAATFAAELDRIDVGARVLEYGCGTGSHAFDLAARGAVVTGIDISPVAIDEAREEARRRGLGGATKFVEMDAHRLQFQTGTFDVVCGSGVLHHLDLDAALPEVARVLTDRGRALFYEPLGTNPLIRAYRGLTPKLRTPDEHPLLPDDFRLAERSFREVTTTHHTALALVGVAVRWPPMRRRILPLLQRADRWLFDHVPGTRWLAWVVVITLEGPIRAGTRT